MSDDLIDEDVEKLYRPPTGNDPLIAQAERMMGSMTAVMSSKPFEEFVEASADVATAFYRRLVHNGIPEPVAGQMAAAYCQNLSQNGGAQNGT